MPSDVVGFTRADAAKVVRATKIVLGGNIDGPNASKQQFTKQCITAKILSQDATDKSKFAWQQQTRVAAGDWEEFDGALSGTTDNNPCYQLDPSATVDLSGKFVLLARVGILNDDDEAAIGWIIISIGSGSTDSPKILSGTGATANTDTWKRGTDHTPVQIDLLVRDYWDTSGDVLGFVTRPFLWDTGGDLYSVGIETVHITDTAEDCSS